jgi:hypothetical protein
MPTSLRLFRAKVTDTADPQGMDRLKVLFPASGRSTGQPLELWVQVARAPVAPGVGLASAHDVGDEVLVAAERLPSGDAVIIGSTRSRSGGPEGALRLFLPNGQELKISSSANGTEISTGGAASVRIGLDDTLTLSAPAVHVTAGRIALQAAAIDVDAGPCRFSGAVKCETIIATQVVGTSYTPGAGNIA